MRKPWPDNLCPNCGIDFHYHRMYEGDTYSCELAKERYARVETQHDKT